MNAQSALADAAPLSLESVELELSMSLQDLVAHGFEGALNRALELTGGGLLFHFPAGDGSPLQRIAAVAMGNGCDRRVLLVTLAADGETVHVGDENEALAPIAGLAASFAGVMEQLPLPVG